MRRLLVSACAALALVVACATGELRGAVDNGGSDTMVVMDSLDALPAAAGLQLSPPSSSGRVFVDLAFPPSRETTADVFRPPQG